VYSISGTTLTDTTVDETWYNLAEQEIPSGQWLMSKSVDDQDIIDFENCGSF
jgi:hypothetical protein